MKSTTAKKKKVAVYLDASNFYYYCKEIGIPTYPHFDFNRFIDSLVDDSTLVSKSYYVGGVRAKPNEKRKLGMMKLQMRLFTYLNKSQWNIQKGYILDVRKQMHEKGVDVVLSLDIAFDAVEEKYDTAILVSSDTDILPAIDRVLNAHKRVIYVGFAHRPSRALLSRCTKYRLLKKDELQTFVV